MKKCTICKTVKPFNDFNFQSNSRTRYRSACKKCTSEIRNKRRQSQDSSEWIRRRHERIKASAQKRNIFCSLTREELKEVLSAKECYYCEQPTENKTVDRVDNSQGYIAKNCVMACWSCNYIKRAMTFKQIKMFYEKIKDHTV